MKVVKVRSPFIIEVNQAGQVGSKIELSIWNGSGYPTSGVGFYSLSKSVPSLSQINTSYNVSNYVKEFIDNIKATYTNYVGNTEQNNEWTKFQIKRYWYNGTTYTLLDTNEYVGVNGFSNYSDGNQNPTDIKMLLLGNTNINNYYYSQSTYPNANIQYYNLLIDKPTASTTTINVRFERIDGIVKIIDVGFAMGVTGIINGTIPISIVKVPDSDYINGCKVTITYTPVSGSPTVQTFFTYPTEECKYTPVLCDFINRYGGWQTLTFFKQQTNTVAVKGTDYKLMPSAINYNTSKGQVKSFNINGNQTIKLNTGFVDENYSELITDLLLSETVLLDAKPVTVKTQGSDLKTSLKDRLINYEIEFEYAYNLINDVV